MVKTIVVTGATSGFGQAIARRFAADGWKLILVGRRQERLEELSRELGHQDNILSLQLDVRDREQVFRAFEQLPDTFANVDVLVNNAGLALGLGPSWAIDIDDWETMIDTNIKGVTYCTRALLPKMVENNSGMIVNIGSTAGNWPYPGGNVYGGTKAFVQQFSRNLRCDLLGKNIRVTNLEPGMAETEFSRIRFKGDEERAGQVYEGSKPLAAADIAEAVHWVVHLPPHVNVNTMEMMSIDQTWSALTVNRNNQS